MEHGGLETSAGVFGICFLGVLAVIILAGTAFWLWMLIDAIKHAPAENNVRLIWILVIVFAWVIGALVYMFAQRPKNPPAA